MKKSLHTMRRPARRCRQRRAACARRRPAQRAAARTNHSVAFLTPPSSAPSSRRFAFALRSFPPRRAPAPAHRRPHPRPHRAVSHSPFAASPPRRAPTTAPAHYRLQPRPHRVVSHSLFAASHRAERPPQRIAALIRNPYHSPPISMPLFEARFAGRIFRPQKTENRAETFIPARNRSVCRLRTPAPGRRTGRATCARSAADRPPD